jgi:site-specific recombinase XerD
MGSELTVWGPSLPRLINNAGPLAVKRFVDFFTARIPNDNTRYAYARAVARFCRWCDGRGLAIDQLEPHLIALYIKQLGRSVARPTVKQHLAAIRMLFDWLVIGQVVPMNPAAAVRAPTYVVKKGKTPVLSGEEVRQLIDAIKTETIAGLRDRALIGVMLYSFARVSAVVGMNVEDYFPQGKRYWFRLHEKGGKLHDVPAHHTAEEYVDAYLDAAAIRPERTTPLFRAIDVRRRLTGRRLDRTAAYVMVKRRARQAGLNPAITCHSFRASGITAYLDNGGTIENAQRIAAHESPRTTKLYDRTSDQLTLDEIERIVF